MPRIYVGNLAYATDEDALRKAFGTFGEVGKVQIVRSQGRSRGFGFVTMPDEQAAAAAIAGLHGRELDGRVLTVNRPDQR